MMVTDADDRDCLGDAARPTDLFRLVPDEIILAILAALSDNVRAVAMWAMTCRRHAMLAMDPAVWRSLYEARFGAPLHRRFMDEGKDWRWLYRALACAVVATTDQDDCRVHVGNVKIVQQGTEWTYWGDLIGALPDGYGLALSSGVASGPQLWIDGQAAPAAGAGDVHEGHWQGGKPHGYGICTRSNGNIYVGGWQDGEQHGHGTVRYADGVSCEGDWAQGKRHGYGSYVHADGTRYDGQWEDGLPHGYGEETSLTGMTYYGLYRAGKRHGYGIVVQDGITMYQGHWADDNITAYGQARYPDGATWRGWSVDGLKCGYGVYRWPDGTEYAGMFNADEPNHNGVYTTHDGERTTVTTDSSGALHAVVTRPDGFTYTGGWLMALGSSGQGTCTYADGSCIVGTWHGATSLAGVIESHRIRGPPCRVDSPCKACKVVARSRRITAD